MKDKFFQSKKEQYLVCVSVLVVIAVIFAFAVKISQTTIEGNINNRVTTELEFLAQEQAELVNKQIENQFSRSSIIAGMVESGVDFSDAKDQKILLSLTEELQLCMLGYADKNGDVINYKGEQMGNISDRPYFKEVLTGKKEHVCQYIKNAAGKGEPRILFSAPVRENGQITGIVFFSKEVEVLRDNMFRQSLFGREAAYMILDDQGDILVKNKRAESIYPSAAQVQDVCAASEKAETLKTHLHKKKTGSLFLKNRDEDVIAYSDIDLNSWHLICVINKKVARAKYAPNLIAIRHSIIVLSVVFCLAIIYFAFLVLVQIRLGTSASTRYRKQYQRMVVLLQRMKCVICEYNVQTGEVITDAAFKKTFGYRLPKDFVQRLSERKIKHPEFDYDGLCREVQYAIDHRQTTSFETIYCTDRTTYRMFSIVIMPFLDQNQEVSMVLAALRDAGDDHRQIKRIVDMFNQVPGGTHRCYLSDPIHLEYAGEGLCRMLGYTVEEFNQIVGSVYTNIIIEEDRHIFVEFVQEAAFSPGVRSCEYRVRCKDGRILSVVDTMESVRQDSGIMYGFSAVTDISEYVKRQDSIQQEMKQLEQQLEVARIKNSASQMQPHFLYNSLASIREVVLENPQYASELLCDFTIYLRACVRTMQNDTLIPIGQEIENIRAYANIEKMRMGDRLHVIYDLQSEDFEIVPLTLQPLVENAIRHGVYRRGKAGGTVRVKTETLQEYHVVIIEDNGVGFDYEKVRDEVENGQRDSTGLDNVVLRLKKQLQSEVMIQSTTGVGTKIVIHIPREVTQNESNSH